MKIGIAGATGFIGSHFLRSLVPTGHECRAFIEQGASTGPIDDLKETTRWYYGNILEPETLDPFLKDCEVVFNLSGINRYWSRDPSIFERVNVLGARNVAERCLACGIERLVHVSSCITLGASKTPELRNEESAFNLSGIRFPYAASKRVAELEIERLVLKRGLPAVIVNPASAIGELDWGPTPIGKPIADICKGLWPVYVAGGACFIDVRELCRGLWLSLLRGRHGERYLLCGENMTNKAFMVTVARAAGVRPPRLKMPRAFLQAYARLAEAGANHVTHNPPTLTLGMSQLIGRYLYFDGSKAEAELGFHASNCQDAIRRSVAWHQSLLSGESRHEIRTGHWSNRVHRKPSGAAAA